MYLKKLFKKKIDGVIWKYGQSGLKKVFLRLKLYFLSAIIIGQKTDEISRSVIQDTIKENRTIPA
jgi:hypothetical protein